MTLPGSPINLIDAGSDVLGTNDHPFVIQVVETEGSGGSSPTNGTPWSLVGAPALLAPTLIAQAPCTFGGATVFNPNTYPIFLVVIDPTVTGMLAGVDALAVPGAQTGLALACQTSLSLAAGTTYLVLDAPGAHQELVAVTAIAGASPSWTGLAFTTTKAHPSRAGTILGTGALATPGPQSGIALTLTAGTPGVLSAGDFLVLDTSGSQETVSLTALTATGPGTYTVAFTTTKAHATSGTVAFTTSMPVAVIVLGQSAGYAVLVSAMNSRDVSIPDGVSIQTALVAVPLQSPLVATAVATAVVAMFLTR